MTKVKYSRTLDRYYWSKDEQFVSSEIWEFLRHTYPKEIVYNLHPLYFAFCLDYLALQHDQS